VGSIEALGGAVAAPVPMFAGPSGPARPSFVVTSGTGRLLEVRALEVFRPGDVFCLAGELSERAQGLTAPAVIFADYRAAPPFSQAVADEWSRVMRAFNSRVAGSAVLLSPDNETFNLQFARVMRCAGSASRRSFLDGGELRDWLRDLLTDVEIGRLDHLLERIP